MTVFATALNASAVCKTSNGVDIGRITGATTGTSNPAKLAKMDISTKSLNCGILGTATWEGTYTVTSPEELGVVS